MRSVDMVADRAALTLGRLLNRILEASASCAGAPGRREVLVNTGWTDEARAASLAVRQAKAAARAEAREKMFAEQRKKTGKRFVENWYPRGKDGWSKDPHIGESNEKAPYGYVDGTKRAREEPLYDSQGRPIVPRPADDYFKPKTGVWPFSKDESVAIDNAWLERVERAEALWGPFGRKKRFMDAHPGATEQEWVREERRQREERKKGDKEDGGEE